MKELKKEESCIKLTIILGNRGAVTYIYLPSKQIKKIKKLQLQIQILNQLHLQAHELILETIKKSK